MGEVLFLFATGLISVLLGVFVYGQRYRGTGAALSPVELEWAREEAEGRISILAPRVMVLAEKERAVIRTLDRGEIDGESRVGMEELMVEAAAADFWSKFVSASALVEEEPVEALRELERLPGVLEEAISKLDEAEDLCDRRRLV